MSWFSGSTVPVTDLEQKINEATSESIPNGELDLSVALEITDLIRSKKIPPKQCMRSLKKRLTTVYQNPNLLTLALKLVDLCVKNGGHHFLIELSSKEFVDYLIDYIFKIHYNLEEVQVIENEAKFKVGSFILSLIKDWTLFFEDQSRLNYVEKCYHQLLNQGYEFPALEVGGHLSNNFIDSEAPPDWIDNDECMICYNPFSLMNRKHHCRSCGGVYCQTHSAHNSPLVALGIMEPVRVCDNCYEKIKFKNSNNLSKVKHKRTESQAENNDDEDEQLRKAIELSLQDGQVMASEPIAPPRSPPPVASEADEEDEEMKAAIAASLKEFEAQEKMHTQQVPAPQPRSEFYNHILPFDQQEPSYNPQLQAKQPEPLENYTSRFQVEDLTQQEEESINLFITLMTNIKGDASKQANILYDTNLSELHTKIIQLKPKLNRSLRASIEKYETCLELNNKVSTISRLYDQFLESKLSQAYGNHAITPQTTSSKHAFAGAYSGQQTEHIPYPVDSRVLPSTQSQQTQGMNQFNNYSTPSLSQQPTGYNNYSPAQRESQQNPPSTSFYPSFPQEVYSDGSQQRQESASPAYYSQPNDNGGTPDQPSYAPYDEGYPNTDYKNKYNESAPAYPNYTTTFPTEPSYPPFEQDDNAEEHAAAKYPPIGQVESNQKADFASDQDDQPSSMPSVPQAKPSSRESEKTKLVEEPLIEL